VTVQLRSAAMCGNDNSGSLSVTQYSFDYKSKVRAHLSLDAP